MAVKPPIVNVDDLDLEEHGQGDEFQALLGPLRDKLGMKQIGCTVVELDPGKRAWPYHLHYGQEELFVILEGEGSIRYDGEQHRIRAGDVIFTPTGPGTAHQIVNTSDARLRYLALSSTAVPEVCYYPDSDKFGSYFGEQAGDTFIGRGADAAGYWDGEAEAG